MHLVERCSHLDILSELLADCSTGGARVALVTGAVATGKTALLRAFAKHAVGSGAVFACATASRAEQTLPLGVLDQLLRIEDLYSGPADSASWLLAEGMATGSLYECDPAAGKHAPSIRSGPWINSLWQLLHQQAERSPLVIGIDNVHYADQYSLLCLSYLIRRLESAALLMVLTKDVAQDFPLAGEFLSHPHVRQIRLELLSSRGVTAMLAKHMDHQQAALHTPIFHQASGGNPLLVTALLADYRTRTDSYSNDFSPGDAFAAAVVGCLYRGRPLILQVARTLAVLGECSQPPLLDELLGLNVATSASAVEALEMMGLVESGRFRHETARKAVLDSMTPSARAATHRKAALMLHETGAAPAIVAPHLVAAGYAEHPWSIRVLQGAGEQALAEHDLDAAIRYLRLAQKSCGDERERAVITTTLASAEWGVSPSTAARHLPELSAAIRAGFLNVQHASKVLMYLLWYGRPREARELLGSLTRRNASATINLDGAMVPEPESIWPWLASVYPDLSSDRVGATQASYKSNTQEDHQHAKVKARSEITLAIVMRRSLTEEIHDVKEIMGRCSHDGSSFSGIFFLALAALTLLKDHENAASYFEKLLDELSTKRIPTRRAVLSALASISNLSQGNLADARRHASAALNLISPRDWGVAVGIPLGSIVLATTMMGEYRDATAYLLTPVPEAMFRTPFALHYLHARGRCYLAMSNFEAALGDFEACGELMTRWGLDLPGLILWRVGAAEACLGLGRRQLAREFAQAELLRVDNGHHRARGISLRIRAAVADISDREALLREAIELLNRSGDRVELAMALADLSRTHDALGESRQARVVAMRARRLADQCGVALKKTGLPGTEESDGPDAGARGHSSTMLSDAESRVATLAAQGYKNREIAGKLYITVSTVEQHLTHVYKKLCVSRRTDLPLDLPFPRMSADASG
jgi:DNA-binding CsgD family transcriptional regulator